MTRPPGIPAAIDTPDILIDLDILERNIARMAETIRAKGLTLRPHAKTHKIPEIAAPSGESTPTATVAVPARRRSLSAFRAEVHKG